MPPLPVAPPRTKPSVSAGEVIVVSDAAWARELTVALKNYGFAVSTGDCDFPASVGEPPLAVIDLACQEFLIRGVSRGLRHIASLGYDLSRCVLVGKPADDVIRSTAQAAGVFDLFADPPDLKELVAATRGLAASQRRQTAMKARLDRTEREVGRLKESLDMARLEVIRCLTIASGYRDGETGEHLGRVGAFAERIARSYGCPTSFCSMIAMAAPLHDVGKIGIADRILSKPGRFTPEERDEMQKHVEIGDEIVRSLTVFSAEGESSPTLRMAGRIASTHHEWFDGSGYPRGLAGMQIPLEGRITAIADVFDALTTARPYKPAYGLSKTLELMREKRGTHFDPDAFDAFLNCLDDIVDLRYAGERAEEVDGVPSPV